jgi:hypothetical protein
MSILNKLKTQKVFLLNDFRDTVIKSLPGERAFFLAKQKGGKEYIIDQASELLMETLMEPVEITEKEYDEY